MSASGMNEPEGGKRENDNKGVSKYSYELFLAWWHRFRTYWPVVHMYGYLWAIKRHIHRGVNRFNVRYFIMFALRIYSHPLIPKTIYVLTISL